MLKTILHRTVPLICFSMTALLGVIAIVGWASGRTLLSGFAEEWIPMAPSTAAFFLLFGLILISKIVKPSSGRMNSIVLIITGLVSVFSLLLFILSSFGLHLTAEHLGFQANGIIGGSSVGHMSPVTAFCFVAAGLSVVLFVLPGKHSQTLYRIAAGLGLSALLTSIIFLVPYFLNKPFLYHVSTIPPAASTLVAFFLLASGILLAFWNLHFYLDSELKPGVRRVFIPLLAGLGGLSALFVITGYFYFYNYEIQFRKEVEGQLEAVAKLKAELLPDPTKQLLRETGLQPGDDNFQELSRQINPLLSWWPSASRSAETVLVRFDSTGALVLNPQFSDTLKSVYYTRPFADKECTCFKSSEQTPGAFSGTDCHGVPVIAYATAVPGTSWLMITRLSQSEIFSPIRDRFWSMIIMLTLFLFLIGLVIGLWLRNQWIDFYKSQLIVDQTLQESEEKFSTVFRNAPLIIIISSLKDGTYLDVNREFEKLTGLSRQQVVGHTSTALNLTDTAERDQFVADLKLNGVVRDRELEFTMPDGRRVTCLVCAQIIEISGTPQMLTTALDITDRKLMEIAIRESEEKFQKIFLSAPYGIVLTTLYEGKIYNVNSSFCRITGYDETELIGQSMPDLWIDPHERDTMVENLRNFSRVYGKESRFRHRDGGIRYGYYSSELITLNNEPIILSMIDDITERKRTEESLRREMARLEMVNDLIVERELQMVELKREVAELKKSKM